MRALGVPWTLHCWMHALAAAHELQLDDIVDQLLHDFLEVCPDDYNTQFIFECLPLLFNIFRFAKVSDGSTDCEHHHFLQIKCIFGKVLCMCISDFFIIFLYRRMEQHFFWPISLLHASDGRQ